MKSLIVTLVAALLSMSAVAADSSAPIKTARPMKIGIIGTGNIGGALARHWGAAGHQLLISSRHPEQLQALAKEIGPNVKVGTPREAAAFGEVILLAVPYFATPQIGRDYAAELKGRWYSTPAIHTRPAMARWRCGTGSGARAWHRRNTCPARGWCARSTRSMPGRWQPKAFQKPERLGIPLAADDPEAMKIAEQLVTDAGFDPVPVGKLIRRAISTLGLPFTCAA
jgi:hypothetical protein